MRSYVIGVSLIAVLIAISGCSPQKGTQDGGAAEQKAPPRGRADPEAEAMIKRIEARRAQLRKRAAELQKQAEEKRRDAQPDNAN